MGLLDGKVVMITGAAHGQGRAHAILSAQEGADVIATDINEQIDGVAYPMGTADDLAETVRQVEALGRRIVAAKADARSQAELDHAVTLGLAAFEKIDCLVVNHGICTFGRFWELTEREWDDMIAVNLTGAWKACKAVAPHMIERESGSIVITSSMRGIDPGELLAHYTSAKHGTLGLMKVVAAELGRYGIRCNAILPGATLTPMTDHQLNWNLMAGNDHGTGDVASVAAHHASVLKATGWMDPIEQARAALFLNSCLAEKITGVAIPVDGGNTVLPRFNHAPAM
jgi:SDR family mycofactocin-dependent oxidoreductase